MIERETVSETMIHEVVVAFTCNVCGRRWTTEEAEKDEIEGFGVYGGYYNNHWGDCTAMRWHACQDCVAAWVKTFAVEPERDDTMDPWRYGDEERLRQWLRFGEDIPPRPRDPILVAMDEEILEKMGGNLPTLDELRESSVPVENIEDAVK